MKSCESINERIIIMTMHYKEKIAVKDNFRTPLRDNLDQISNRQEIIIVGELNNRVGQQSSFIIVLE